MSTTSYLGYRPPDEAAAYAKYFAPAATLAPTAAVTSVLGQGPLATGSLPAIDQVATLLQPGYTNAENGYTLETDGAARVAVLTPMPGVSPLMWDWWFGWHGDQESKYKLWHPHAHVSASWKDGEVGRVAYVGRTSHIQEYIGKTLEKAAIQFVDPARLGLPTASPQQVFICARIGFVDQPLDYGWLVHQVRVAGEGAEMRSRFWIGGEQIKLKTDNFLGDLVSTVIQRLRKVGQQQAADLLTHCSEEMSYLATFLPALYAEFGPKA